MHRATWFSRRRAVLAVAVLVLILIAIQLIPFGHQHTDPPVQTEPRWDSPTTRVLAARACLNCHGNQTTWPWYSNVAPVSWLVQNDVDGGRQRLNFQDWNRPQRVGERGTDRVPEVVRSGGMPLSYYQWLHAEARLTAAEREQLAQGLANTIAQDPPPGAPAR